MRTRAISLNMTSREFSLSTVIFLGSKARPVRRADTDCQDNVGALTSHNPIGLHGLLRG
jgi:hypothetical protein